MTKVRIINGSRLGNILFQYSAGRAIALNRHEELTLDFCEYINWFDIIGFRAIRELGFFHLEARIYNPLIKKLIKKIIATFNFSKRNKELFLDTIPYSQNFIKKYNSQTIQGFFQSEKYFENIRPFIKSELQFKDFQAPERAFTKIKKLILGSNSIAIHVRRGDLIKELDGYLLSNSYYAKAIDAVEKSEKQYVFFIFSDDINWCRKNPLFANYNFVDLKSSKNTSIYDFYLMSLCKHQIIANSTFSWWAAWLNENKQKMIIAPHSEGDFPDKYPSDWKLINQ